MPHLSGDIKYEHLHRYALARELVRGREVLDIACGEGYGAALISATARAVVGVDIDADAIEHARRKYASHGNLTFRTGSCDSIPLPDESVDVVTSFETIEHHDQHREMMREMRRVLRPEGVLIISSPNRPVYAELYGDSNPFHVRELDYQEFTDLLKQHFRHVTVYGQKLEAGSFVFSLEDTPGRDFTTYAGNGEQLRGELPPLRAPSYFIALCSDAEMRIAPGLDSIYLDKGDSLHAHALEELRRLRAEHRQTTELYIRHALELEEIKSHVSYKLISRFLWPVTKKLLPQSLRSHTGRNLSRMKNTPAALALARKADKLRFKINENISHPFVIGKGNLYYLSGWCYHPRGIRRLYVLVEGEPHEVFNHSLAETEACRDHPSGHDPAGNCLTSRFWTAIPFSQIDAPREVKLSLRGALSDESESEVEIGTLSLLPFPPPEARAEWDAPSDFASFPPATENAPRVVICMATHQPPLDLFALQIESLIGQSHQNWLCAISDDCSDPSVFREIQRLAAADARFRVFRNPTRLGFYRNFERCLKLAPAAADFIAFSDQDDYWYPDKLAASLAEFRAEDVHMVYSDMDIVTRDGEVVSRTYWKTRRNNSTDLESLLIANSAAGASIIFRAGLLAELLPFPAMGTDLYHDHWVACAALAKGRLGYVDRPLYAYRQHEGNVIGYVEVPRARLWAELLGTAYLLRLFSTGTKDFGQYLPDLYTVYNALPVRTTFMAGVLKLRLKDGAPEKRAILERLAGFERSPAALLAQAAKSKLRERSTLGIELICLRSALNIRLLKTYFRLNRRRMAARGRQQQDSANLQLAQSLDRQFRQQDVGEDI
jgi:ubiquinone/menaquinone biosynthesis C-methylase UbiE/glycosyltransferase involved in cell wall biosynthesis